MKLFPVLLGYGRERIRLLDLGCPESVPWEAVAPHEAQALRNHGQSLERLAERGGLSPLELLAVIGDCPLRDVRHLTDAFAVAFVQRVDREPEWAAQGARP